MRKPKLIAAAAILGLLSIGIYPSAAHAAYPTSSFYVSYGNSVLRGHVTWYNRSLGVSYTIKSATDCKTVFVSTYDNHGNADHGVGVIACEGQGSKEDSFTLSGAAAGGFQSAEVLLVDESGRRIRGDICTRGFDYCIDDDF